MISVKLIEYQKGSRNFEFSRAYILYLEITGKGYII
jgi:hypothetical protein